MAKSLELASSQLVRCPTCYYNFRRSICAMSCSPDQSDFINVTETAIDTATGTAGPRDITLKTGCVSRD